MEAATLYDYVVQGEKLTDGPVDVWLDRCWWGKHQGLKQLKPYSTTAACRSAPRAI